MRIVLGEVGAIKVDQGAGRFDAGWPTADNHDVQCPIVDKRWVVVGSLPPFQDMLLQTNGIGQGIHGKGVLRCTRCTKEIDPSAQPKDQVIVRDGRDLLKVHLAPSQVDAGHARAMEVQVGLLAEQVAQRVAHLFARNQVRSHLVEHGLKGMVVVHVDERNVGVGLGQFLRCADPGKAAAQDQHLRSLAHVTTPGCSA